MFVHELFGAAGEVFVKARRRHSNCPLGSCGATECVAQAVGRGTAEVGAVSIEDGNRRWWICHERTRAEMIAGDGDERVGGALIGEPPEDLREKLGSGGVGQDVPGAVIQVVGEATLERRARGHHRVRLAVEPGTEPMQLEVGTDACHVVSVIDSLASRLKALGADVDNRVMLGYDEPPAPPPPTAPNTFQEDRPEPQFEPSERSLRGMNVVAGLLALLLAGFTFARGLADGGSPAYAIGRALGSLMLPVIIGAVVGWGNERRARIAFICAATLFLFTTLAQAGAEMGRAGDGGMDDVLAELEDLEPAETLEEDINNQRAVLDDALNSLDDRDFTEEADRGERIERLLEFAGTVLVGAPEGQCLVGELDRFTEDELTELETFGAVPSNVVLSRFSEAARTCGVLPLVVENFRAGMIESGSPPESIDVDCASAQLEADSGASLFALTGNRAAMVVPEFVDPSSPFLLAIAPIGECLRYGDLVSTEFPGGLSEPSIECLNEWGSAELTLLRYMAGDMGDAELFAAVEGCVTSDEMNAMAES